MKYVEIINFIIISIVLFSVNSFEASYVDNGEIIILRSQYADAPEILVDGFLDEDLWINSGLLSLELNGLDGISTNSILDFRFANNDDKLFIGLIITNIDFQFIEFGVYFDTLGDGVLNLPEDGKSWIYNTTSNSKNNYDKYWTGSEWVKDGGLSSNSFTADGDLSDNQILNLEFEIDLLSSDIVYDGLQIPSTSNTFLGLGFNLILLRNVNETVDFQFPSSITNASSYIDLKLAGPEDKDLPTFIPPTQITETLTTVTVTDKGDDVVTNVTEYEDSASFQITYVTLSILFLVTVSFVKRRRKL